MMMISRRKALPVICSLLFLPMSGGFVAGEEAGRAVLERDIETAVDEYIQKIVRDANARGEPIPNKVLIRMRNRRIGSIKRSFELRQVAVRPC